MPWEDVPEQEQVKFTGTTGRSARNNNFLNIEYRPGWQDEYGATPEPKYGRFSAYPSQEAGYRASLDLINRYQQNLVKPRPGGHTLESFVHEWSPPHENPTAQLVVQYSKALGVSPQTPLADIPAEKIFDPMAIRESSTRRAGYAPQPQQGSGQWVDVEEDTIPTAPMQASPTDALLPQPELALSDAGSTQGQILSIPEMVGRQIQQPPGSMQSPNEALMGLGLPFVSNDIANAVTPSPETAVGMATGLAGPVKFTAPLTGMGMAAAGAVKRGLTGKEDTYQPSDYALMEQGLPMASDQMMVDFGFGAGADLVGSGVARVAGKLLGAAKTGAQTIIEWARQNKIPVPADVAGSKLGKLAENLPDIGLAGMFTQLRRQKTAQGLTEAVEQVSKDVGLPIKPANEVGQDVANLMHGLVTGSEEYTKLQSVLSSMPHDAKIPLPEFKDALLSISKSYDKDGILIGSESKAFEKALDRISNVYGRHAPKFVETVKEIIDNNFMASPQNIATLDKLINKGLSKTGWEGATGQVTGMADRLKGENPKYIGGENWTGYLTDLLNYTTSNGDNLGKLILAKNDAYKNAMQLIKEINPELNLLYKKQMFGKGKPQSLWQITQQEKNLETVVDKIFRPNFENKAIVLKEKLDQLGRQDVWETAKMAWIKKAFDNATFKKGDEIFFSPTKYKSWYDGNKDYINRMMPDQMQGLQKWYDVSSAFEADIKRFSQGKPRLALGSALSGLGGLVSFGSGGAAGVAVPQAMAFLSAVSVMPGAVRMYLPKASGKEIATMMGQTVKGTALEYRSRGDE